MKPGGETERARPSLGLPEQKLLQQQNPAIKHPSDAIKRAASRNDVTSENARTVKAALKTAE